jgi:hypothetical protein
MPWAENVARKAPKRNGYEIFVANTRIKYLRDPEEERMIVCKKDARGRGSEVSSLIRGCNDWIL